MRFVQYLIALSLMLLLASASNAQECTNGMDDDGDGKIDFQLDHDGDGVPDNNGDPGCRNRKATSIEGPECDDQIDNDFDGVEDHLGGFNALGFPIGPDPDCQTAWWDDESQSRQETGHPATGNGGCAGDPQPEMALALLPLAWLWRWRKRRR